MTKYVSIDIETTGLDPVVSEVLEVGIVIFDSEEPFIERASNCLRIVLVKDSIKGNVFAINMNQKLIKEMIDIAPKFDEPNADSILEEVYQGLGDKPHCTTWYVDLRNKNLLDDLYGYDKSSSIVLDKLKYKITEFLSAAKVKGKLNIVGKNFSSFDKRFLEELNCFKSSILDRSRHRVLDVGSMYVTSKDDCLPDLKECLKRAGLNCTVPHTAVEDAILVVKAAQYKFNAN